MEALDLKADKVDLDRIDGEVDVIQENYVSSDELSAVADTIVEETMIDSKIATAMANVSGSSAISGEVATEGDLPASPDSGTRYVVNEDSSGRYKAVYEFDGTSWNFMYSVGTDISGLVTEDTFDAAIDNVYSKAETDNKLEEKVETTELTEEYYSKAQLEIILADLTATIKEEAKAEALKAVEEAQTETGIVTKVGTFWPGSWFKVFENFEFKYSGDADMFHASFPKNALNPDSPTAKDNLILALNRKPDNYSRVSNKTGVKKSNYGQEQTHFSKVGFFSHGDSHEGYIDEVWILPRHKNKEGAMHFKTLNHGDGKFTYIATSYGGFGISDWKVED